MSGYVGARTAASVAVERGAYPAPGYVLGSSETERQRLVRQAKGFAAEASWLLDQAGLRLAGELSTLGAARSGSWTSSATG
jgi:hypothetical protein